MAFLIGKAPERLAVIDGDSILYGAAFATQRKDELGKVHAEPFTHAIHLVNKSLDSLLAASGCTDYELHLNGKDNFRYAVAKYAPYKGNRKPEDKPVNLQYLMKWAEHAPELRQVDGMESDDSATISYLEHVAAGTPAVLCHIDKDLDQVPGDHYNWNKQRTYNVGSLDGHHSFWQQVLTGDTSDNIVGLEDIGPAWAKDILSEAKSYDEMHQRVADFYRADLGRFDGTRRYRENAKLLWMLRSPGAIWDHKWSGL